MKIKNSGIKVQPSLLSQFTNMINGMGQKELESHTPVWETPGDLGVMVEYVKRRRLSINSSPRVAISSS